MNSGQPVGDVVVGVAVVRVNVAGGVLDDDAMVAVNVDHMLWIRNSTPDVVATVHEAGLLPLVSIIAVLLAEAL